mmetsp:Transcript_376/g.725  ORF Transcript_376/g.725 Transcript_376/m.725 type:complete len:671 (+) Transcript_376:35-2047(+)
MDKMPAEVVLLPFCSRRPERPLSSPGKLWHKEGSQSVSGPDTANSASSPRNHQTRSCRGPNSNVELGRSWSPDAQSVAPLTRSTRYLSPRNAGSHGYPQSPRFSASRPCHTARLIPQRASPRAAGFGTGDWMLAMPAVPVRPARAHGSRPATAACSGRAETKQGCSSPLRSQTPIAWGSAPVSGRLCEVNTPLDCANPELRSPGTSEGEACGVGSSAASPSSQPPSHRREEWSLDPSAQKQPHLPHASTSWVLPEGTTANLPDSIPSCSDGVASVPPQAAPLSVDAMAALVRQVRWFASLSDADINRLLERASVREFPRYAMICREGGKGSHLYVVMSGTVRISSTKNGSVILQPGGVFGESCIRSGTRREETAQALQATRLMQIGLEALEVLESQVEVEAMKMLAVERGLVSAAFFKDVPHVTRREVARLLQIEYAVPGELIFSEGDASSAVYFILEGSATAVTDTDSLGTASIAEYRPDSERPWFGELALLGRAPRAAAIRAVEPCTLFVLKRPDFARFLELVPAFETLVTRSQTAYNSINSVRARTHARRRHEQAAERLVREDDEMRNHGQNGGVGGGVSCDSGGGDSGGGCGPAPSIDGGDKACDRVWGRWERILSRVLAMVPSPLSMADPALKRMLKLRARSEKQQSAIIQRRRKARPEHTDFVG